MICCRYIDIIHYILQIYVDIIHMLIIYCLMSFIAADKEAEGSTNDHPMSMTATSANDAPTPSVSASAKDQPKSILKLGAQEEKREGKGAREERRKSSSSSINSSISYGSNVSDKNKLSNDNDF